MIQAFIDLLSSYAAKVLAIALLTAALAKFVNRAAFADTIRLLGLARLAPVMSIAIPVIETLLGVGYALTVTPAHLMGASVALFTAFASAAFYTMFAGKQIECSCFGNAASQLGAKTLVADIVLIVLAVVAARETDQPTQVLLEFATWFGAAALVALAAAFGRLRANATHLKVLAP